MMVLQGSPTQNVEGQGVGYDTDSVYIWPADRCSWTQTANSAGGYDIENARFWLGASTNLSANTGVTPNLPVITGADAIPLMNVELGFIGKSGRFVKITA